MAPQQTAFLSRWVSAASKTTGAGWRSTTAVVLANFKEKDVDTLLDLMKQAQVTIPLKAVVTPSNRSWVFGDLLAHLQEEHAAFTAAKENHTV